MGQRAAGKRYYHNKYCLSKTTLSALILFFPPSKYTVRIVPFRFLAVCIFSLALFAHSRSQKWCDSSRVAELQWWWRSVPGCWKLVFCLARLTWNGLLSITRRLARCPWTGWTRLPLPVPSFWRGLEDVERVRISPFSLLKTWARRSQSDPVMEQSAAGYPGAFYRRGAPPCLR